MVKIRKVKYNICVYRRLNRRYQLFNMPNNELNKSEKYISSESPEISVGERVGWVQQLKGAFPALENRNYRLYFMGQMVSLIGTWLQTVAQGWLVYQLTESALYMGLVTALGTLPTLIFTLWGGVVVDRFPKKSILMFTQTMAMVLAMALGVLTITKSVELWHIGSLSFLLGTVNALDAPARQAFVSELVPKAHLPSAIALNSGIFNMARAVGPSIAGLLIVTTGTGGAFVLNSLSYIAVIAALLSMNIDSYVAPGITKPLQAIKAGLIYCFTHPIIRILVVFTGVNSVFGWSYATLMPLIAQQQFHVGAGGLGYLYAFSGIGAFTATLIISFFSKKVPAIVFILGGNTLFALSIILFSMSRQLHWAYAFLFLSGFGLISSASMMNSTIQRIVLPEFRGRVMSIYVLMFIGMVPLGNMQIGYVSEHWGTSTAIQLGASIVFVFGTVVFLYRHKIIAKYDLYKRARVDIDV